MFYDILAGVHGTPIEEHLANGTSVYVKREDLAYPEPFPPLAKMRGIVFFMKQLKDNGQNLVGVYDTRISKAGWGVAAAAKLLNMQCVVYQALPKSMEHPPQIQRAKELGAEIIRLPGGMLSIAFARAKKDIVKRGGSMVPMGLYTPDSVRIVGEEAATVGEEYLNGSLVVSIGSATMVSGIIFGLKRLPQIYGISCGMSERRQCNRVERVLEKLNYRREWRDTVTFIPPKYGYYQSCSIKVPFPCSPFYDAKAWEWMLENFSILKKPILFWNIGA